jgi:hypothetical protein
LYILIFRFFILDGKTKDFGLNNSKHSPNLIYSWFHHECHSDLLVSSPSIWILPPFQTTLTPLSLPASYRLSLPIIGLNISYFPTFSLKSPIKIFIWYLGNWSNTSSSSS